MSNESKRNDASVPAGAPDGTGNESSSESLEPARSWTDEEMREAVPLPVPSPHQGEIDASGSYTGRDVGEGQTKLAGRPEGDGGLVAPS